MLPRLVLLASWAFYTVAARPVFTNTNFDVEQGTPFTLHYQGCDDGCTIALMTGDSANLRVEEELTTSATGDSFTFTLSDLDAGTYAFRITSGSDSSYSTLFELDGDSGSSESETAASSETPAESTTTSDSKSTSTSTSTSTPPASSSSITGSESSTDSQTTTTSTSSGVSSTISTASQATTTAPSPPKHGLSAGAIAEIVVGVVAVILIVLGAFFWMRRRQQKAAKGSTSGTDPRDLQPQIAELEQPKNIDIVVTPATPAEMRGSTPPPPAAELTGQGRVPELPSTEKVTEKELEGDVAAIVPELQGEEKRTEKELEGDVARTVPELHGEDKALPAELPGETARKDNEEQQKRSPVLPPIELPSSTQEPQEKETETSSAAQIQPSALASALPKSPSDAGSSPFTKGISSVSPVSDEASQAMLMEQYAQLEARRQRILELKTIEEEQAALRARLSKMQGGNGTE
ncbi:GPI-anchored domain-containing protein [Fusarium sp. LHS14.1]|nr:GPI-anchored domain-containing protein [Fusarium sp. LHS14.1]